MWGQRSEKSELGSTSQFPLVTLFLLTVGWVAAVRVDRACYGVDEALACSQHQLQCQEGSIFLLEATRGFKPASSRCAVARTSCNRFTASCCRARNGDCLESYSQSHFQALALDCWNRARCTHRVPPHGRGHCNSTYEEASGFSQVDYLCLEGELRQSRLPEGTSQVVEFQSKTSVTGSAVAVSHFPDPSDVDQTWHCRVESRDCSSHPTHVLMAKFWNTHCRGPSFSTVCLNKSLCLPCSGQVVYQSVRDVATPFSISLHVSVSSKVNSAWTVIQAVDAVPLKVTCGTSEEIPSLRECSGTTSSSSSLVGGLVSTTVLVVLVVLAVICYKRWFKRHGALESREDNSGYSHPIAPTRTTLGSDPDYVTPDGSVRAARPVRAPCAGQGSHRCTEPEPDYVALEGSPTAGSCIVVGPSTGQCGQHLVTDH